MAARGVEGMMHSNGQLEQRAVGTTTRRRMEKNDENAADDGTAFARFLNGRFFDVEKASSSASFVLIVKRE